MPIGSVNYTYEAMTHPTITNLAYNPHEYFHNIDNQLTIALNDKPANVFPCHGPTFQQTIKWGDTEQWGDIGQSYPPWKLTN